MAFQNVSFFYSFSTNKANPYTISIDSPIVTTSTTTQPQNGDEDEDSNVLLRHVAHQDDDAV